mmetsp:Transcript_55614/g.120076  ORF Transcript_55614/g.120076 Transcript_55614/m.120076 type:complete len:235 (-) Transcript_55614:1661-2365(-)
MPGGGQVKHLWRICMHLRVPLLWGSATEELVEVSEPFRYTESSCDIRPIVLAELVQRNSAPLQRVWVRLPRPWAGALVAEFDKVKRKARKVVHNRLPAGDLRRGAFRQASHLLVRVHARLEELVCLVLRPAFVANCRHSAIRMATSDACISQHLLRCEGLAEMSSQELGPEHQLHLVALHSHCHFAALCSTTAAGCQHDYVRDLHDTPAPAHLVVASADEHMHCEFAAIARRVH